MDTDKITITNAPATLADLEHIIEEGELCRKLSYVETGKALYEIHARGLFKETHRTWQDYITQRWGFSRQRAHQLMQAWEAEKARREAETSTTVDIAKNEREARARLAEARRKAEAAKKKTPLPPNQPPSPPITTPIPIEPPPPIIPIDPRVALPLPSITVDLAAETQFSFNAYLQAETEAFQAKMAHWEEFLSTPEFDELLEAIEGIIVGKLDSLLEASQLATATA